MTEPTDTELDAVLCKHWPAFSMQATLVRMWVRAAMRDAIAKWDTPPAEQPDLTKLTERGAKAWAGVDAQALRDGTYQQAAPKAAPAWADQAVIEYRYTGGTHWCPLGPAERMKPDFDGVYRLQGGVFPVEQAAPKAAPVELSADSLRHQNKLLAETLGACILASGIVRKDIDGFTGPELLHFGEDLRSMLEVAPKQEAQEPIAWLVPMLQTFKGAERVHFTRAPGCTMTDAELIEHMEGRVVWIAKTFSDSPGITDKFGVEHKPKPLYTAPQPAPDCHHRPRAMSAA
jgi:hypothetical protein